MIYRYTEDGSITDGSMTIPAISGNRHYDELMESGVEILPYVPPAPPMPNLTSSQLRLMMRQIGLTEADVDDAIATKFSNDQEALDYAMIEWKNAASYRRDHPLVVDLAVHMGFTVEELDALWLYAAQA